MSRAFRGLVYFTVMSGMGIMNNLRSIIAAAVLSMSAHAAEQENANDFRPTQCLLPCAPGRDSCEPDEVDEFPDFDAKVAEIVANCRANRLHYLVAVEGMCADGTRLLHTGTGFENEIQLFTEDGKFEALIHHPDHGDWICKSQFYWPRYRQCEAPVVVSRYCGMPLLEIGEPAFANRWEE